MLHKIKIMDFRLFLLILLLHISGSLTLDSLLVTCSEKRICAVKGSQVALKCFNFRLNIKTLFWFSHKQSTNWRINNEPEDLTLDSDYSGRVKYQTKRTSLTETQTLIISDVKERDSGEYQLMFIMEDGVKHLASVSVYLTVTDLQVKMKTDPIEQTVQLSCDSSCTSKLWLYYWRKDGQRFQYQRFNNTIVVLNKNSHSYSCSADQSFKNPSLAKCVSQSGCWDVTYTSRRVCALINSTVEISSTYSYPSDYTVIKTFWHYVQPGDFKDLREEHQFAGRVEYVEKKLRIKELKISDSGEYRFRIITDKTDGKYSGSPGVFFTVTDTQVISSPAVILKGEKVILSCRTKCTLSDKHTYIWYKNGRQVTDGFTKANKLYLDSVSSEELKEFSCAVGEMSPEVNTALQNTLIVLVVFLIIALTGVLLYRSLNILDKRRKKNSSEQHEDAKEAVQPGSCPVYETVAPVSTVYTQQVHIKDQDVHYSSISFKHSDMKNTSLVPTAVHSTTDDVHYAAVKFG